MTKTLKQILEGYEARSADEKRFIDKHVVVKHEDRNGNGDDVFKAKKIKTINRKDENHGHGPLDDGGVYEEVLGEETIGHFSNAGPFIRITKGTDRVTKKPTRHVEIHNGKAKTRLITSVDPKWDNAKIKDHLLKTHGDKLKPVTWKLNEEALDEGQDLQYGRKPKVVTKNYSWGKMKTIHKGADFSIPMHPEHHEPVSKLKDGESHHFTDETRTHWTATRSGDDVHFQSSVGKVKVPHASLNEEVLDEAVPSHMYHRTSNGPVNPSAVAGAHHTTPEQRRAAKLKREAKEKLKEETQLTEAAKLIKRVKRALKAGK